MKKENFKSPACTLFAFRRSFHIGFWRFREWTNYKCHKFSGLIIAHLFGFSWSTCNLHSSDFLVIFPRWLISMHPPELQAWRVTWPKNFNFCLKNRKTGRRFHRVFCKITWLSRCQRELRPAIFYSNELAWEFFFKSVEGKVLKILRFKKKSGKGLPCSGHFPSWDGNYNTTNFPQNI